MPADMRSGECLQFLDRDQVREVDRIAIEEFGIPGIVLMENAGRACCDVLFQVQPPTVACILAGTGNNGGDGFVIARHLVNRGVAVKVLLVGDAERVAGDARTNLEVIRRMGVPVVPIDPDWPDQRLERELNEIGGRRTDWVIDGLLGTGATGNPRPPMDRIIRTANAGSARRLAIDLPSGLDCDSGQPGDPTIRADVTCTMVAAKQGFQAPSAKPWVGQIHVVDIGSPREIVDRIVRGGV